MEKTKLEKLIIDYIAQSPMNIINEKNAIDESTIGLKIFEGPLVAISSAYDEMYEMLKEDKIVGTHHMSPSQWLPISQSVISIFLPFSQRVKDSNSAIAKWPSKEWMQARIEGQDLVGALADYVSMELNKLGYKSLVPSKDDRFKADNKDKFTSNWSERHVAFISGLGTFGLSKGLISKKGVAGRYTSIITEAYFKVSPRPYRSYQEYCSMCGKCIAKCPVGAISIEKGKDHKACSEFLTKTSQAFSPWYGCGKCQTGVDCESQPAQSYKSQVPKWS